MSFHDYTISLEPHNSYIREVVQIRNVDLTKVT